MVRDVGRSMLAFRTVQQSNHCAREQFLYELKAGPAGGRLRRPSSAGRPEPALDVYLRTPALPTCSEA
jgi:hypothetical protein